MDNAFTAEILQFQGQLRIGNRWNLGGLVIGYEWVGISLPLINFSESFKST